jgi:CBS domain-containing protein
MDGVMIECPFCEAENIEGADVCEQCGQPLSDMYLPTPDTAVERSLLKDRMSALSPKAPLTVAPETSVGDVMRMLVDHGIGCAMVVDSEKLVGIFTERDALVKLNVDYAELSARSVSEFMTQSPEALDIGAKIAFAVQRMDLGGYRHLPIVDDDGHPTGIISVRDILRYLTEKMTTAEKA